MAQNLRLTTVMRPPASACMTPVAAWLTTFSNRSRLSINAISVILRVVTSLTTPKIMGGAPSCAGWALPWKSIQRSSPSLRRMRPTNASGSPCCNVAAIAPANVSASSGWTTSRRNRRALTGTPPRGTPKMS